MSIISTLIQTPTQANKIIKALNKELAKTDNLINKSMWDKAAIYHQLQTAVAWKITKYGCFSSYIESTPVNLKIAQRLCRNHRNRIRLGYTDKEMVHLSQKFTFNALGEIFRVMSTKMSRVNIIKEYGTVTLKTLSASARDATLIQSDNRIVSFNLPLIYVNKLDSLLALHGMEWKGKERNTRIGVSNAMINLLDTL